MVEGVWMHHTNNAHGQPVSPHLRWYTQQGPDSSPPRASYTRLPLPGPLPKPPPAQPLPPPPPHTHRTASWRMLVGGRPTWVAPNATSPSLVRAARRANIFSASPRCPSPVMACPASRLSIRAAWRARSLPICGSSRGGGGHANTSSNSRRVVHERGTAKAEWEHEHAGEQQQH